MNDHAQAKINLINAAMQVADGLQIKIVFPLTDAELACLKQLKRAANEYKTTKQAKRFDENGDEFDSLHGGG